MGRYQTEHIQVHDEQGLVHDFLERFRLVMFVWAVVGIAVHKIGVANVGRLS